MKSLDWRQAWICINCLSFVGEEMVSATCYLFLSLYVWKDMCVSPGQTVHMHLLLLGCPVSVLLNDSNKFRFGKRSADLVLHSSGLSWANSTLTPGRQSEQPWLSTALEFPGYGDWFREEHAVTSEPRRCNETYSKMCGDRAGSVIATLLTCGGGLEGSRCSTCSQGAG